MLQLAIHQTRSKVTTTTKKNRPKIVFNESKIRIDYLFFFFIDLGQPIPPPTHHQPAANPPVNSIPTSAANPSQQTTSPPNTSNGSQAPPTVGPPAPQQTPASGAQQQQQPAQPPVSGNLNKSQTRKCKFPNLSNTQPITIFYLRKLTNNLII